MSLDVHLIVDSNKSNECDESGIFIREDGQTKRITRQEWDERYPGREPIAAQCVHNGGEVFHANITHNLNRMAREAGVYECLWRPEEIHITTAHQLIIPLRCAVMRMRANPERFKELNPENGWGSYDMFVPWIEKYVEACEKYPHARVEADR